VLNGGGTLLRSLSHALPLVWALGCGSTGDDAASSGSTPTPHDAAPSGFSVGLHVVLTPDPGGETLTVLNPAASPSVLDVSGVVGKPYYAALFEGGFDQGVDLDLHHEWGTIPEGLVIDYQSPPGYTDGPYDVAFIVYTDTEITDAVREDLIPPTPHAGELSAFSLSQDRVKDGDPGFGAGVIRVNVEHADASVTLENRVPADVTDGAAVAEALADTILAVP
jgi:hypothetical protein